MQRHLGTVLTAAAIALALPAAASANQHHKGDAMRAASASQGKALRDAEFIKKAAQGNMAEVELGELALQRAASAEVKEFAQREVKEFAQRMIDDHRKANEELASIASKEGVTLPKDVDPAQKATKQRLAKLSGHEFDRAYMREMQNEHGHDIALFEREASQARDTDLKNWIEKTLPTLKEHRQLAQDAGSKVGVVAQGQASGEIHGGTARRSGAHPRGQASR